MIRTLRALLVGLFSLAACVAVPAAAQSEPVPAYSQDELDQLLAPIALYPDDLLMQVLIASTYPLEVVEAARFVRQNSGLAGAALDQAVADRNWDPSVQSLTGFPQVLAMMDDRIEWTQRLGDAFLTDEARVMDTVQSLRQRAEAAGNLQSTPQQIVTDQGGEIFIAPAQPDVIYVPVYDPLYVYGPWWAPAYPPWFWYPPAFYGYPAVIVGIVFGRPCHVSHDHWGWAHVDWQHRHIRIDGGNSRFWNRPGRPPPPPGAPWEHSPGHRRGIAYPNAATRDRYLRIDPNAVRERQQYRGYELRAPGAERAPRAPQPINPPVRVPGSPSTPQPLPGVQPMPPVTTPGVQPTPGTQAAPVPTPPRIVRPAPSGAVVPQQRISPFDPGVSRQQAEANAQRGMQSRQSIGPAAPPAGHAPSAPPAGARGGHPGR